MTEQLKPCPFCGGNNMDIEEFTIDFAFDIGYIIRCRDCGCTLKSIENNSEQKAIEAWNRRANDD